VTTHCHPYGARDQRHGIPTIPYQTVPLARPGGAQRRLHAEMKQEEPARNLA
jgi:hypothetical protein